MKPNASPRVHGPALRAAIAAIESPALGDAAFALMARQMGIEAMLAEPLPDQQLSDLSSAPSRKEPRP
jgi:hypothetical protein